LKFFHANLYIFVLFGCRLSRPSKFWEQKESITAVFCLLSHGIDSSDQNSYINSVGFFYHRTQSGVYFATWVMGNFPTNLHYLGVEYMAFGA